jgi:hypothetical protein
VKIGKIQVREVSPLRYEDMLDGKRVKLLEDFVVWVRISGGGWRKIAVPAGFVSDLASVPWLFRRGFPRFGPWNAAAVIHDYLYAAGAVGGFDISKEYADRVFLALMLFNPKCSRVKARFMYMGVRIGALGVWRKYRRGC